MSYINTTFGSSGSSICNDHCEVIGIHTSGNEIKKINYGIYIGKILDDLKNGKINGNKNYIIAEINTSDNDINKNIRIINSY